MKRERPAWLRVVEHLSVFHWLRSSETYGKVKTSLIKNTDEESSSPQGSGQQAKYSAILLYNYFPASIYVLTGCQHSGWHHPKPQCLLPINYSPTGQIHPEIFSKTH